MTQHEYIEQLRAEMHARQRALKAEIAALEEVKRFHLRNVARTLAVVPPDVERYLASPNPFLPVTSIDVTD